MRHVNFTSKFATMLLSVVLVFCSGCVISPVATKGQIDSSFPLVSRGLASTFVIDPNDAEVVSVAAQAVCGDIQLVTGVKPTVSRRMPAKSSAVVLAGTLGKNQWLNQLVAQKRLDAKHIRNNPWESYLITVVEKPFDGISQALVVAGSDRRGTAYGLFELSKMAGVSPWVWWADVMPDKRQELYIRPGLYTFGPPSVQYRGIFLNDEDYGLKPWAAKTYEPEVGDIGPKTYAKICELLLRLKANFLWPAMHGCTGAFNNYPENKVIADRYAIVMGSSHCEPLLFNTATEWDKETMGPWQYDINRQAIYRVLDQRVKENGIYENVYTVGMRGIHDSGMAGNLPMAERVNLLQQIFRDEREILERRIGRPAATIPQIFVPYKEVLPIYDAGLIVPEDVTLVWADDNYGYIRRYSNAAEQKRSGGAGVYYHISYWGAPHCYLWLGTTPPALIWKELRRLYETNGRTLWVVNVGDIKPCEIGMEFFLQMAWDISRWNETNLQEYTSVMAARDFGEPFSKKIGDILNTFYVLNLQRKPEYMGFNRSYPQGPVNDPQFSLWNDGDECAHRLDAFESLLKRAETVYAQLPQHKRDAYYQLVLYPVFGAAKMNEKILCAYRSREYAKQGRVSANQFAQKAQQAYEAIIAATADYNDKIAAGKWRYMMSSEPRGESVFKLPPTGQVVPVKSGMLGVAIEGSENAIKPAKGNLEFTDVVPEKIVNNKTPNPENALLRFYGLTGERYFIDLFNYGASPVAWKASLSDKWIRCTQTEGTIDKDDQRIWINIDESQLPKNKDASGTIHIAAGQLVYEIAVRVFKEMTTDAKGYFGEQNGVISLYAADAVNLRAAKGRSWKSIPGLGRSGRAMGLFPLTGWHCENLNQAKNDCPMAEYRIAVSTGGKAKIHLQSVPAFPLEAGRKIQCAVSIDDKPAQWISFDTGGAEGGGKAAQQIWEKNVLNGMMEGRAEVNIAAGVHQLRIWGTDPSVVLDKIIIRFADMPPGYFGPAPTRIR